MGTNPLVCSKHGPDCDFSLSAHPLPSQGWATEVGPYPDWITDDPTGEMADIQAEREQDRRD